MKSNQYPRILVISPVKFNQQTGSGVTMGNLFHGWPLDSIAQIHSENWTEADTNVCNQYFHLPYKNIRRTSAFSTAVEILQQILQYIFYQQQTLFGHFTHRKELLAWSQQFAPDVIYTRPLDRPSFSVWLPHWLSHQLDIPYITRILDDWPTRHERDPILMRRIYWRLFLRRCFNNLLLQAAINLGISEEMCEAFQERYQAKFISFHNCIDFNSWQCETQDYSSKEIFELVYMGSIKVDKELQSLLDIKEVILNLNRQGKLIRLTIFGPENYAQIITEQLEVLPMIKYGGFFKASDKFNVLKEADLLVLPLNFDPPSASYLGYSFQTKVPEYMASGTPVLVYGPTENPNVRYAYQHQWAAIVDKPDKNLLKSTLEQLIANPGWRKQLGKHARKLALQNHDSETIRTQFQQLLRDVAARKLFQHHS